MKLPKAIEICTIYDPKESDILPPDYMDAVQLLIEAGKRIQESRTPESINPHLPLPGETLSDTSPQQATLPLVDNRSLH